MSGADPFGSLAPDEEQLERRERRFGSKGLALRRVAARGTLINAAFTLGTSVLGLLKGLVLAGFLSRADYGIWGILGASLGTLLLLRQVGIGDKYVQQEDEDQELAFQKAFTLELLVTVVSMAVLLAALPLVVVVYGESELLWPGLALIAILPAGVLQMPIFVHYRRMDFFRQRVLQSVDPVVGFVVAVALAVAGASYWAFVGGLFAGAWASAALAVWKSPYRLAIRYDREALRSYASFSWPMFLAVLGGVVIAQSGALLTDAELGLAAVGAVALAANISVFTERVDFLITGTLYPAICAVRDNLELLHETFVKSNRIALMWSMPFGFGLALFASDLVAFGIGEEWRPAVVVLEIFGVVAALSGVAFNWDAYYRALDNTRPLAVASLAAMVTFLATTPFLLAEFGLGGFAAGVAAQAVAHMAVRAWYVSKLFHGFSYLTQLGRAIVPTLPAVALVFVSRWVESGERVLAMALGELTCYIAVTVALTLVLEGRLVREALGYLRAPPPASSPS